MSIEHGARVAVVTGGGRGIGRATALRLAEQGRDVVVAEVGDFGEDVVAEVETRGRRAIFVPTDVTDKRSVEILVDRTIAEFGRIDILVNCAGVFGRERPFAEQTDDDWDRVMRVNFGGALNCCRACLPSMLERGWGRIVTITSAARHGAPHALPYGVSKAAVTSLMNGLAATYAKDGVLVNCVEPGRALTDMVVPRFSAEFLANPPGVALGRYSTADEVGVVVSYLTAEENTYTVGAIWRVAGSPG